MRRASLSMLATLSAVITLTAAPGCRPSRPWEEPHGGWQAVYSDHFVLYAETWSPTCRYVLDRLEDTYAGLSRVFFEDIRVSGIEVLLLSDEDYVAMLGAYSSGMFFPRVPARDGLLVIRESRHRSVIDSVVSHELVHKFIAARYPAMPPWLDEGIAEYLATVKVHGDEVEVGRLSADSAPFGSQALVSLRELAHANGELFHGSHAAPSYQAATAFVRWLLQPRSGGLDRTRWHRLVSAYRAGSPAAEGDGPDAIMSRVYPELSWNDLQTEVQAHIDDLEQSARYPVWVFRFDPPPRRPLETAPADLGYIKTLCQALRKPVGGNRATGRATDPPGRSSRLRTPTPVWPAEWAPPPPPPPQR